MVSEVNDLPEQDGFLEVQKNRAALTPRKDEDAYPLKTGWTVA